MYRQQQQQQQQRVAQQEVMATNTAKELQRPPYLLSTLSASWENDPLLLRQPLATAIVIEATD
jgi:hypothetical protein